jgi:CRP-like cAMP-binding protein
MDDNQNNRSMLLPDETRDEETNEAPALNHEEIKALLAAHPFLKGWDPRHVDLLASGAALEDHEAGDLIFKQGDAAERFYLIIRGCVSLTHAGMGGNVHIQTLSAGEVLGWSWLVPPSRSPTTRPLT